MPSPKRGATLGLLARRREPLDELAESLQGDGHVPLVADVTDPDAVAAAVEEFGDVDVVVANAGITHYRPFAAAAARRGAPHERRELARNDLHGLGGAAAACSSDGGATS